MATAKIQWKTTALERILDEQEKALVAAGFQIEAYIKKSMGSTKGGGPIHIPSSPGQPPAVDTGRLRASISTNWTDSGMPRGATDAVGGGRGKSFSTADGIGNPGGNKSSPFVPGKFIVVVGTNVEYGPPLEWGAPSHNLAPRPFIRPAFDWAKPRIVKMMKRI